MAEVVLTEVVKQYGEHLAVDHVSLTINDGEFVTLVGPSGCGKTTTLNMVAGLLPMSDGEIRIGGRVVNDLDPKDRDIAMVFQNYALYPHKSVRQNLEFPLRMRGVEPQTREQRIARAAEILGITQLLERKPRQLSGGQQQRVALGRAIVRDPAVFLMDEPLSNLDAKLRVHMRTEIKHLQEELKATFIYVTHDQMEAMTMSDRVAIMDRGKLQQYGSPHELYHRPANTFVAGFIGSPPMNLLPVTAAHNNGAVVLRGQGWELRPQGAALADLARTAPSPELVLGFRHTAARLGSPDAPGALPAEVYTVEPTGDATFVHLRLGGHLITTSTDSPSFAARAGDCLGVVLDETRVYLFDAHTTALLTRH